MTRWQANTLLLGVAVIWGSAFVAQNRAMDHLGPMAFTGIRFLVGALVVLPLAWREWRQLRARGHRHAPADGLPVLALGLMLAAGAAMQQIGIQYTSVTNAGFLTTLYVPLVPLLAWAISGQRPHPAIWPMVLGCIAGTYLLSGAGQVAFNKGDLWVLASVLPWALHVLFVGSVADRLAAPFMVACGQFVVCGVASLAWAVAAEPLTLEAIVKAAWAIAYAGVLSVGIGFTGQVVAQRHTLATDAAILMASETLFAALFGYWLMGDRLTAAGWTGGALIFGCMLAVQWLALRPAAKPALAA